MAKGGQSTGMGCALRWGTTKKATSVSASAPTGLYSVGQFLGHLAQMGVEIERYISRAALPILHIRNGPGRSSCRSRDTQNGGRVTEPVGETGDIAATGCERLGTIAR